MKNPGAGPCSTAPSEAAAHVGCSAGLFSGAVAVACAEGQGYPAVAAYLEHVAAAVIAPAAEA